MPIGGRIAVQIAAIAAAMLLLTGCLLTPGKFTANMTVMRNGGFTFAYRGEIHMMGLSQLVAMGAAMDNKTGSFIPNPCYGDPAQIDGAVLKTALLQDGEDWAEDTFERECTETEIERQKTEWDDQVAAKKAEDARMLEMVKGLLGGIDPSSPDAIEEFIVRIKKQKGWRDVVHQGDGLFMIDYTVSGRIDQDFTFPVIEKTQGLSPFVVAAARANGAVRIDAPAFAATGSEGGMGGGMAGLMQIMRAFGSSSDSEEAKMFTSLPKPQGSFTIRTDGEILTNNTDDGPVASDGMKVLQWTINARRTKTPEALIMLDPA
ncbi:hypothetical protein [Blastomonas aquatica]|uniref:Lipoprotein n=1 Tax=Blastomonas aquatica TaxID=1510276 RepID=A0ABQ1JF91_9SPHN|nr:hypothetical protein [Blastomonas aquatica]GGB67437.1 hypothetical protein GCM10010833_23310 [Blastomonas aquatica]